MSQLTQVIFLLYKFLPEDQQALESQLLRQMKLAYKDGLQSEARRHGCSGVANDPSGSDLRHLKSMAKEDAKSIAETYNRDVLRHIEKLYRENPRGNRNHYSRNMQAYIAKRSTYKVPQISLNTETRSREYARSRFWQENGQRGNRYMMDGPPPVCPRCIQIFGMGILTQQFVDGNPCPIHMGCTHRYVLVSAPPLVCAEVWLG